MTNLFILTHCAAEENYRPMVFDTLEKAKAKMNKIADELIYQRDNDGEVIGQYSDNFKLYPNAVSVNYSDDTYDVLEIFEVGIPGSMMRKEHLLSDLLDERCEIFGITNTIQYLLDKEYPVSDIVALGFDRADVERLVADNEVE